MSNSVRPHRRQPTRLPGPWDSPGKNTGVGCHFLLQCMKVKSEREVAQLCLTLSDPMDCSLPGSSVHDFPGKSTGVGCHCLLRPIHDIHSKCMTDWWILTWMKSSLIWFQIPQCYQPFLCFGIIAKMKLSLSSNISVWNQLLLLYFSQTNTLQGTGCRSQRGKSSCLLLSGRQGGLQKHKVSVLLTWVFFVWKIIFQKYIIYVNVIGLSLLFLMR